MSQAKRSRSEESVSSDDDPLHPAEVKALRAILAAQGLQRPPHAPSANVPAGTDLPAGGCYVQGMYAPANNSHTASASAATLSAGMRPAQAIARGEASAFNIGAPHHPAQAQYAHIEATSRPIASTIIIDQRQYVTYSQAAPTPAGRPQPPRSLGTTLSNFAASTRIADFVIRHEGKIAGLLRTALTWIRPGSVVIKFNNPIDSGSWQEVQSFIEQGLPFDNIRSTLHEKEPVGHRTRTVLMGTVSAETKDALERVQRWPFHLMHKIDHRLLRGVEWVAAGLCIQRLFDDYWLGLVGSSRWDSQHFVAWFLPLLANAGDDIVQELKRVIRLDSGIVFNTDGSVDLADDFLQDFRPQRGEDHDPLRRRAF